MQSHLRKALRLFVFSLVAGFFPVSPFANAALTLKIGLNFSGVSYGQFNTNSTALPPDCNGAIGLNHFVQFINGMFSVYRKADGRRVLQMTDLDFWGNADVGIDTVDGIAISDPRIIYDPSSQRWFACQIDFDSTALNPVDNNFLLAVSETADPTGFWDGWTIEADPTNGYFADFPTLGLDDQGVYLSGNMFDGSGSPVGVLLVSIPKAELLANPPEITNFTSTGTMDYSVRGQVMQPAICLDGSSRGDILATGNLGDGSPHSTLVGSVVQNAAGPGPATLAAPTSINVTSYIVPINPDAMDALLTPEQPDSTSTIEANDARFSAKVYAVGGVLYAVHNTELNNHIAIRWYRLNAADFTLLESGTIAPSNLDLFFPSIAANSNGVVVIGCNGCGTNTFVSCYAIAGQTAGGVTTFGDLTLLASGTTNYHGDDEALAALLDEPALSRWGDYSATSVDPSDPSRFWTIQMFPSDTNVWTTQISQLLFLPQLTIAPAAGNNVLVSWPAYAQAYHLQSTVNLAPTNFWQAVPQMPSTNSSQVSVLVPASSSRNFFRLQSP